MNPSLLLVDDSEDDAYFFRRALQKSGITCVVHHRLNGAEAMDFLSHASEADPQNFPQVMFLDLKMPVVNGFEVLDWLQTQAFSSQLRVIVLSGSEQESDRDRATQLGAKDYLVKPVTIIDLDRLLRDFCPVNREIGARV